MRRKTISLPSVYELSEKFPVWHLGKAQQVFFSFLFNSSPITTDFEILLCRIVFRTLVYSIQCNKCISEIEKQGKDSLRFKLLISQWKVRNEICCIKLNCLLRSFVLLFSCIFFHFHVPPHLDVSHWSKRTEYPIGGTGVFEFPVPVSGWFTF